ncbi:hypothetical protein MTR_7g056773 [Medicago truncatula]|uniref:TPR1-like CTLH-containing domain-containing protein n=1 Tax=Medicago truncatula TaxID=3880 RepID=A0A072UAA7_MEDTR|nr:hypothetical protein MTR_7g056773 [Medicago truncatula]
MVIAPRFTETNIARIEKASGECLVLIRWLLELLYARTWCRGNGTHDMILKGKWDEAEKYPSGFTKVEDNDH